jgi:hypothetical protein
MCYLAKVVSRDEHDNIILLENMFSWTNYPQEVQTCDIQGKEIHSESDDGR